MKKFIRGFACLGLILAVIVLPRMQVRAQEEENKIFLSIGERKKTVPRKKTELISAFFAIDPQGARQHRRHRQREDDGPFLL